MGFIYKRKNSPYLYVQYRDEKGIIQRRSTKCKDRICATQILARLEKEVYQNTPHESFEEKTIKRLNRLIEKRQKEKRQKAN